MSVSDLKPASPLPWRFNGVPECCWMTDAAGECVAQDARDAQYAVHAANCYPVLVAALKELVERHEGYHLGMGPCVCDAHIAARKALALAESSGTT